MDNQGYVGGALLPECQKVYANYLVKYLEAYKAKGVDIWAMTPVNEPYGNGNNWESMFFDPKYEAAFVRDYMAPIFEKAGFGNVKILGYDQNRGGIPEWVDAMYSDEATAKYFGGLAVHWYESTVDWDWGWDWAPDNQKYLHPKYVPVFRYARDIIGCLNNWVAGWIDWNMVLDRQGGPNWAKNWCLAPVIVDPAADEVYFTPMYYAISHFSRFLRPDAKVLGVKVGGGSLAVVVINQGNAPVGLDLAVDGKHYKLSINKEAIQTIVL